MAMMLEYKPGMSLTDPWVWSLISRTNPGFQINSTGVLKPAAATAIRDSHWIGGVRTTLMEPVATNIGLQSQTWATSPWTQNGHLIVTNNAGTAPDGTATASSLIPDATTNYRYAAQPITIVSGEFVAASCFVKASGYTAVVFRFGDANSTNGFQASFDLATGTFGTLGKTFGAGTISGFTSVALANGWYWIGLWGQVNAAVTAGQVFCYVYNNIADANSQTAGLGNGTSGILAWGAQVERNGTLIPSPPTSYIATTVGTLSRGTDAISTTWPFPMQSMWLYMKFVDLGWSQRADFGTGPQWTNASSNNPSLQLFTGAGSQGQTPSHRLNWRPNTGPSGGANQISAFLTPGAAYGDTVELFGRFFSDAHLELNRSINGAAVTTVTGAVAGGVPFVPFATPTLFYLNASGLFGLQVLKIGADPTRIITLAQAAPA